MRTYVDVILWMKFTTECFLYRIFDHERQTNITMENSYRQKLEDGRFRSDKDNDITVVVESTITLLRRHNVGKTTMCPKCNNDDPQQFSVTEIDRKGFITEVECQIGTCKKRLSTICHSTQCHYDYITDLTILRPGDHITWHRPYLIWHHAVVTNIDGENIVIHEYKQSKDGPYLVMNETKLPFNEYVVRRCYKIQCIIFIIIIIIIIIYV